VYAPNSRKGQALEPVHLQRSSPSIRPCGTALVEAGAIARWLPLQDEMTTLSTNSSHPGVPYTRDAIILDETAAHTSSQAICDVVERCGSPHPCANRRIPNRLLPTARGIDALEVVEMEEAQVLPGSTAKAWFAMIQVRTPQRYTVNELVVRRKCHEGVGR
jgi:hypothetical protein